MGLNIVIFFINLVIVATLVQARVFTDEEVARLPRLFYLDDYDKCLAQNGVYCVGKFQLFNDASEPNPTYELIQEYSEDITNFNRTFLYRGYCLTSRCSYATRNISERFERCVDDLVRFKTLRARLHTLHYCRSNQFKAATSKLDIPRLVFTMSLYALCLMNIIGTVYDYCSNEKTENKNKIMMSWSVIENWKKFSSYPNNLSEGMKGIDSVRVILSFVISVVHIFFVSQKGFQFDEKNNEEQSRGAVISFVKGSVAFAQIFIFISSFLTTFQILVAAEKIRFSISIFSKLILKRMLRLWPIYIFSIGFAATLWVDLADGPVWPVLVESESNVCRSKFWAHVFFLHNFISEDKICILPTWIIAVGMQMFILNLVVVGFLIKYKSIANGLLMLLSAFAIAVTFSITYKYEYVAPIIMSNPQSLMVTLGDEISFTQWYIKPWNCIIVFTAGVILGYIQYYIHNKNIKIYNQWLSRLSLMCWTVVPIWHLIVSPMYRSSSTIISAATMVIDRVFVSVVMMLSIFSLYNEDGVKRWSAWIYLGRISFAMSMIHWQVCMYDIASRRTMYDVNVFNTFRDGFGTLPVIVVISFLLTILVEYPLQKTFDIVMKKLF